VSESMEELTEALIEESGQAKQLMRDAGFGVTGTNLLLTTQEVLAELSRLREIEWMYDEVCR
jgi:hypothetical protein